MRFVSIGEVLELGVRLAGPDTLADFDLLDSAVCRPINYASYAEEAADLHTAAAHLLFGILRNHPFIDGNKRVALAATALFYFRNGWTFVGDDAAVLSLIVDSAEGILSVAEMAGALKAMVRAIPLPDDEGTESGDPTPD